MLHKSYYINSTTSESSEPVLAYLKIKLQNTFWAKTKRCWYPEVVWVWAINLKWCTCTDVYEHSSDAVLYIEEHAGLIISLNGDPGSLYRTFPLTSDRHSSQRVQREGKSASVQSSAGGSVEVHHSLFSRSTLNICQCSGKDRTHLTSSCNSFDDGIRLKHQIYCRHQTSKVFLQMIKERDSYNKSLIIWQTAEFHYRLFACLWSPSAQIYATLKKIMVWKQFSLSNC